MRTRLGVFAQSWQQRKCDLYNIFQTQTYFLCIEASFRDVSASADTYSSQFPYTSRPYIVQADIELIKLDPTRMWANAQPDGRPAEYR